jgi:hypothetical protein
LLPRRRWILARPRTAAEDERSSERSAMATSLRAGRGSPSATTCLVGKGSEDPRQSGEEDLDALTPGVNVWRMTRRAEVREVAWIRT